MNINEVLKLNNGEKVKILNILPRYSDISEKYCLIQNQEGKQFVISEIELSKLRKAKRTTTEKIKLYKEYFAGRSDVFAQKWSNGKGFSPALENWWDFYQAHNNPTKQLKLIKQYKTYTMQVIYDQIVKDDPYHRYGIYPLLPDNCTNLLVFDFDQHDILDSDPKEATLGLIATCRKYHLDCLPEISQSGQGYHIWIFFKHVPAKTVRELGTLLLLETISTGVIDFTSFDRMIPNQDYLDKKGFGNLIALPLKWSDVQKGKSIFTNNALQPIDPSTVFDRLASVKRYSEDEVHQFLVKISHDMGLMSDDNLLDDFKNLQNLPKKVNGYIDGEICIKKSNLTRSQQLSLLSLATFKNPEYIKKQRMRMPVWNIPSMITIARINSKYLCLPRGCLSELNRKCHCQLEERFTSVSKINVKFNGKLRDTQQCALDKVKDKQLAMICGHTGFGKTVVGLALISLRCARTVIIVSTTSLAKQWQKQAFKFLKIFDKPFIEFTSKHHLIKKQKVEIISGSRNHPSHLIDIITIQKLTRMSAAERKKFFSSYNQVIVDECHHIAATTFEKVLASANCKYLLGLTATPERKDGLEKIMHMRLGPIVYQSSDEVTKNVLLHRYLYPRYCGITDGNTENKTYNEKIQDLATNSERNEKIVKDVMNCLNEGRHILLLSERIEHLKILNQLLRQRVKKYRVYLITGNLGDIKEINLTRPAVILSTSKYVGEGLDLPSLDTLFVTMPFSWKGNTKQYIGRLERNLGQKDELRVFDYIDITDDMFANMYKKRLRIYRQAGYEMVINNQNDGYQVQHFDFQNYLTTWKKDLRHAKSIYLRKRNIDSQLVEMLLQCPPNCKITVEIPNKELPNIQVKRENIDIIPINNISNNICIFDKEICWYGNLNFGGIIKPNMSAVRINNIRN